MTRRQLFDMMQQQNLGNIEEKLKYLQNYILTSENYEEPQKKVIKKQFSYLKSQFKQRWNKAHKTEQVFIKNNEQWLQGTFEIPKISQSKPSGRPQKSFQDLSERSRRRKTEEIRDSIDPEVLLSATQSQLRTSGKRDASALLKEITVSPKRATKYRK